MPQVCFEIIVYNGDFVLEPRVRALIPFGKVIVAEGPVGFYRDQGALTSTDRTNEILHDLLPADCIVHGQWDEKDEMVNAPIHLIPHGTEFVWHVDSDEIWEPASIERVLAELDQYDSCAFKPHTFFGGFERTLGGFEESFTWYRIQRWQAGMQWETHRPPTILAPDGRPWREHRHWDSPERFFHYSYVFASQVKAKSEYYASRGGTIPDWYERVWLPWVLGNRDDRYDIEQEFDGVHEWLPERRGPAWTQSFGGQHPASIRTELPRLKARFIRELKELHT